jgi:hypothetical protein
MLSIRSAGLAVLDPTLFLLDSNRKLSAMLGERLITPGTRMSSLVQPRDASVLSLVAAHLARPAPPAAIRRHCAPSSWP